MRISDLSHPPHPCSPRHVQSTRQTTSKQARSYLILQKLTKNPGQGVIRRSTRWSNSAPQDTSLAQCSESPGVARQVAVIDQSQRKTIHSGLHRSPSTQCMRGLQILTGGAQHTVTPQHSCVALLRHARNGRLAALWLEARACCSAELWDVVGPD